MLTMTLFTQEIFYTHGVKENVAWQATLEKQTRFSFFLNKNQTLGLLQLSNVSLEQHYNSEKPLKKT